MLVSFDAVLLSVFSAADVDSIFMFVVVVSSNDEEPASLKGVVLVTKPFDCGETTPDCA